jgi:hypothetical protein
MNSRKRGLLRFPALLLTNLRQLTHIDKEIDMGLDMYAYTIKADLLDPDWETDLNPHKVARRAVGFLDLTDAELEKLPEQGQRDYFAKRRTADERAKNEGWFNPDFYYWRKFNALHAWMGELYTRKGGTDPNFNCNTIRLTLDDLSQLVEDAVESRLKPTAGFFWGNTDEIYPEDLETIGDFVRKARAAIERGDAVIYDSWW